MFQGNSISSDKGGRIALHIKVCILNILTFFLQAVAAIKLKSIFKNIEQP